MEHIHRTIADIDQIISRYQQTREALVLLLDGPVSEPAAPPERNGSTSPAQPKKSGRNPGRKPAAATATPARTARNKSALADAVDAILPSFGDAWFSVEAVKEKVIESNPELEDQLKRICVLLIGRADRNQIESKGTGRDRRYRNIVAKSYDDRKKELGLS